MSIVIKSLLSPTILNNPQAIFYVLFGLTQFYKTMNKSWGKRLDTVFLQGHIMVLAVEPLEIWHLFRGFLCKNMFES